VQRGRSDELSSGEAIDIKREEKETPLKTGRLTENRHTRTHTNFRLRKDFSV
jgi:hypothetical protein